MKKKYDVPDKIKRKLMSLNLDAFLVKGEANIRYLTGFFSPGAAVLILRKGEPVYFIDRMNRTLCEKVLKGKSIHLVPAEKSFADFLQDKKIKRVAFNSKSITVADFDNLRTSCPKVRFVSKIGSVGFEKILETIREIKTPEEIKIMRYAAKETVRILKKIKRKIKPGMTERRIRDMIDADISAAGYENSFPTIVASGPNTAYPHADATKRQFKKNDHLMIDFGIKINDYCSDLTRTLYDGRINPQIKDFHKFVIKAQKEAIKKIKPGVLLRSVSREVDDEFASCGVSKYSLHGVGHGVGVEVHEAPFFSRKSRARFKKGMVLTVEPGLYKAGLGGVREEDMVLVTEKGCEVLTR